MQPNYPPLARQARIQGQVVLQAVISKEGTIQNLQLISGHPMLAPAAIEAVKQWRYKPYLLNGEPVEVDTQVVVNFSSVRRLDLGRWWRSALPRPTIFPTTGGPGGFLHPEGGPAHGFHGSTIVARTGAPGSEQSAASV